MTSYTHKSVLLMQSVDALALSPGCIAVDGTVGLGGHSEEILKRVRPNGILIGIDRDKNALLMAKRRLPDGFMPVHENFFHMPQVLHSNGIRQVDGILLDLGVSSYQLDEPMRGFSSMMRRWICGWTIRSYILRKTPSTSFPATN